MFFGKKLKEMRLKHANMGIHKFHDAMNTSLTVTDLFNIEHGYAEPPEDIMFLHQIILALGISAQHEDWLELMKLYKEPFIMKKMSENFIPSPLTHKSNGEQLTKEEFINLAEHVNSFSREHNKKADEYNQDIESDNKDIE